MKNNLRILSIIISGLTYVQGGVKISFLHNNGHHDVFILSVKGEEDIHRNTEEILEALYWLE
jgi:hypothetical protein